MQLEEMARVVMCCESNCGVVKHRVVAVRYQCNAVQCSDSSQSTLRSGEHQQSLQQCTTVVCLLSLALHQVMQQMQSAPPDLQAAAASAAAGDIIPLKMMVLDVVLAPADGSNRTANAEKDPIITIACQLPQNGSSSSSGSGDTNTASGSSNGSHTGPIKVAFVLASPTAVAALPSAAICAEGFSLRLFATEASLLLAWRDWVRTVDPDGFVVFQVMDWYTCTY